MEQINEIRRIEQDRNKFNSICHAIGHNNAVGGENCLNSVLIDYNKLKQCRALVMQIQRPSQAEKQAEQQLKELRAGHKITLMGCN